MKTLQKVKTEDIFMGNLPFGCDLLGSLTDICSQKEICLGRLEAIGAVKKARIGYFNQKKNQYEFHLYEKPMEILCLMGNISIKDGSPMIHAHITLADNKGNAIGGHLAPDTTVFACEFVITSYHGPDLIRRQEPKTGLALWDFK